MAFEVSETVVQRLNGFSETLFFLCQFHQLLDHFLIISHGFGFLEIEGSPFLFVLCQLDLASQYIEVGCRSAFGKDLFYIRHCPCVFSHHKIQVRPSFVKDPVAGHFADQIVEYSFAFVEVSAHLFQDGMAEPGADRFLVYFQDLVEVLFRPHIIL